MTIPGSRPENSDATPVDTDAPVPITEGATAAIPPGNESSRRMKKAFRSAFFAAAVLYLLALNPYWTYQRDSAVYMDLARSLGEGRGYTIDNEPQTMYPPGFPAILWGVGSVFGMPERLGTGFLAMNVMETCFGLGCILLVYLLLRDSPVPPGTATGVLMLWCFSRTLYYYSAGIMTDVPFTFFALAALWCGIRMLAGRGPRVWIWCAAASLMALAACTIRAVGPVVGAALIVGMWTRRGALRKWRGNLVGTAVVSLPSAAFIWLWTFFGHEAAPTHKVFYFRNSIHSADFWMLVQRAVKTFADNMEGIADAIWGVRLGMPLGVVFLCLLLIGMVKMFRRGDRVLSAFAVLHICAVLGGRWVLVRRYLLPVLPILLCWLVLGIEGLEDWLRKRSRFFAGLGPRRLAQVCVALLCGVNLARIGEIILEYRSPRFYDVIDGGRPAEYATLTDWLRETAKPGEAVLCYEHSTVRYFTRLRAVRLPTDTRRMKPARFVKAAKRENIRYVIRDPRKDRSVWVIDRLKDDFDRGVRVAFRINDTEILEVDPTALRRKEHPQTRPTGTPDPSTDARRPDGLPQ